MRRRFGFVSGLVAGMLLGAAVLVGLWLRPEPGCPSRGDTLTVVGGKDVSSSQQRRVLIDGWRGPDGERARLQELPGIADLQHSQLAATAQDGGCDADLYILDLPWIEEFARAGYLRPLAKGPFDELARGDLLAPVLEGALRRSGYGDGTLWAVPFNADAPLLYYRKDLLDAAGLAPPKTWPELWDAAARLLEDSGNGLEAGYGAQLAPYEGFTVNLLELIWSHDDRDIVEEDGDVAVNQNSVRDVQAKLAGARPLIDRRSLDWDEPKTTAAFASGRTLFMRNWPTAYRDLAEDPSITPQTLEEKYGVAPLPGRGVLGGQSLAIAAGTRHAAAAERLIRTLTGRDAQHRLFWCGGFAPVRTDVYAERGADDCPATSPNPAKRVVRHLPWSDMPTLRAAVATARPRPASPSYTRFSRVFQQLLTCRLQQAAPPPPCAPTSDFARYLDTSLADALRGA